MMVQNREEFGYLFRSRLRRENLGLHSPAEGTAVTATDAGRAAQWTAAVGGSGQSHFRLRDDDVLKGHGFSRALEFLHFSCRNPTERLIFR
jgi:hypothetical protein